MQNYQYDEAGNITMVTTVTDAGSATDERTVNDLNQITEQAVGGDTWTFSYDDNGNMTGKTDGTDTWTYTWNGDENRLVRVQGPGSVDVAYSYDSMGRMVTRDDGGPNITQLTWDNWNCVKEVTGESETVYHIPQGQILSFIRDGVSYQTHSCALGSVRMITDEAGEVAARYEFDGWGRAISVSEDAALTDFPIRFIGSLGCYSDIKTSLVYMRQRWYDSALGRFLSRDPIGFAGGTNLYAYVENSPLNFFDPYGLKPGDYTVEIHEPAIPYNVIKVYQGNVFREFANRTSCCEAARKFNLNPAAVCAVAYHESSFYNVVSALEDAVVGFSWGNWQLGHSTGQFGLDPSDVYRQAGKKADKSTNPDAVREVLGTSGVESFRTGFLDSGQAMLSFAAWFSLQGKPKITADQIKHILNPGTTKGAQAIDYNGRWERNKGVYIEAFNEICDCKN